MEGHERTERLLDPPARRSGPPISREASRGAMFALGLMLFVGERVMAGTGPGGGGVGAEGSSPSSRLRFIVASSRANKIKIKLQKE